MGYVDQFQALMNHVVKHPLLRFVDQSWYAMKERVAPVVSWGVHAALIQPATVAAASTESVSLTTCAHPDS